MLSWYHLHLLLLHCSCKDLKHMAPVRGFTNVHSSLLYVYCFLLYSWNNKKILKKGWTWQNYYCGTTKSCHVHLLCPYWLFMSSPQLVNFGLWGGDPIKKRAVEAVVSICTSGIALQQQGNYSLYGAIQPGKRSGEGLSDLLGEVWGTWRQTKERRSCPGWSAEPSRHSLSRAAQAVSLFLHPQWYKAGLLVFFCISGSLELKLSIHKRALHHRHPQPKRRIDERVVNLLHMLYSRNWYFSPTQFYPPGP